MFLFPVAHECSHFVACMSLDHFQILALSHFNNPFVREYVFLYIILSGHLFHIYSGQVNLIFDHTRVLGVIIFSHFREYAFFLPITAHSIFIFNIYREIQSFPDSNELISLRNVNFCMCIYLLYLFLFTISIPLSGCPYTNDLFNISRIELHRHWREARSLCTQFWF